MEVKIKKLDPLAVIPKYAHESDAGLDLTITNMYEEDNN
jgi:dUTPase